MRRSYTMGGLDRDQLADDPIQQFVRWLKDATEAGLLEPNAMSLATVGKEGRPTLRTVLLKHLDADGFVFFTNQESRKARQIAENPHVSLLFPWLPLERQAAVCGVAEKLSAPEVLKYFLSRPRDSQLAAWASPQSQIISSRQLLLKQWDAMKRKFSDGQIPVPPFWGGYRVKPETVEFWQGGEHRLHDRFLYTRQPEGGWKIERLSP